MLNFDRYKSKIEEFNGAFAVNAHTLEAQPCNGYGCHDCLFRPSDPSAPTLRCTDKLIKWLCEEYHEPLGYWSNTPIDTKVLGSDDGEHWYRRHFAGINDAGKVTTWYDGATSWSAADETKRRVFRYIKLAEEKNYD